ncbi:SDR family NAD(P)-dependent oxidoreductase [Pseudomonas piscis]|uniref:SDR family NAD(P)-dependent oxidoreductase n=1 Tax=Pseudomonas piscis TaxID=2614538 RepID=UPI00384A9168
MNADNGFNPFSLKGKRILVTGASSGLGLEIAVSCARMGAEIVATGRDQERLSRTLEELKAISDLRHQIVQADLTVAADRDALIAAIDIEIHGLVHCAGISRLSPIRMISEAHLRLVNLTNLEAPMLLTQGILKRNLVAVDGSILFLASIAAHIGVAGVGAYSGTKAALIAMSRCLAMELVKRRIRVNCLSPAMVETPIMDATAKVTSLEGLLKDYPLGFGRPDDIANAAIFMLSGASRWITGTTLVMDGGLTIS